MSLTKQHTRIVFLILLATVFPGGLQSLWAGGSGVIRDAHGSAMRTGYLVVRLAPSVDVRRSELPLPEGVQLHSRLLQPQHTSLYGDRTLARSTAALRHLQQIEDRLAHTVFVTYGGPIHPVQAAAALMKHPLVTHAEPWYVADLQAVPNDPELGQQDALATMRLSPAWDVTKGNASVVIGISDDGVDQTHEDLRDNLWTNTGEVPNNGLDDDGNGVVDDYQGANFTWQEDGSAPGNTTNNRNNGHGTKVAGIAGASTNNGKGMAGVAWNCRLFPMKTARVDGGGIIYGYQSLVYAARMGFAVVNASWGLVKPFSPVDQDVIDYCTALGTLVVASAGNHGSGLSGDGWSLVNFPSGYDGVLGVGETSSGDVVQQTSGLGVNARVMAPGFRALTTVPGGGYTTSGVQGTSFASPMAAGVAALVKAHRPTLQPRQIAALIAREAANIDNKNPGYARVLPGRVDAATALTADPLSAPGLRIAAVDRRYPDGRPAERFDQGDTLDLLYTVVNDLGATGETAFTLDVAADNDWSVLLLKSDATIGSISAGTSLVVGPFRIVINGANSRPCVLSLFAQDNNGYSATMLDNLNRSAGMSTFENDQLIFSIGDNGTFGYSSSVASRQGIGFNWKTGYGLISPSGLLFSAGDVAVKAYDNLNNVSEFRAEKPFIDPDRDRSVMTDEGGGKDVGVRISQHVTFPSRTATAAVISVTVEARTGPLVDPSVGYFFDWDIGNSGVNNTTRLAPEALPTTFREFGVAQAFERADVPVAVVCAAVSNDASIQPQSAGMMLNDYVDDADGLVDADVLTLLNSGTQIQTTRVGDACGVIGMKFPGTLQPGDRRAVMIVIGVGATAEEAATVVRQTIENPNSVREETASTIAVAPHPASDVVSIRYQPSATMLRVVDLQGVVADQFNIAGTDTWQIDVSKYVSGTYRVVVETPSGISSYPLLVVH